MSNYSENKTIIHLKKSFPCTADVLFEAFLTPSQLRQWFSPPGFTVKDVKLIPEIGGEYNCLLEKSDGMQLIIKGIYKKIIKYSKICFSFMYEPDISAIGESNVTITFKENKGNTEITLVQEIFKTISTEGRTKGWEYMLEILKNCLSKNGENEK